MGWGAPQGNALVVRNAVSIVPDVAGEVTDVPVAANVPLRSGDVPVQDRSDALCGAGQGDRRAVQARQDAPRQMTQLYERDAGRGFDVETAAIGGDQLSGQLEAAQWNLEKTVVRAPADGYVTNLALRQGRAGGEPAASRRVMAFIDTSSTIIGVEINQIDARYIAPGQEVEATFKFCAGADLHRQGSRACFRRFATGQTQTSGTGSCAKSD